MSEPVSLTGEELHQMASAAAACQLAEAQLKVAALSHRVDILDTDNRTMKLRLELLEKDGRHVAHINERRDALVAAQKAQRILAEELGERYAVDWRQSSFHPETGAITLHAEETPE